MILGNNLLGSLDLNRIHQFDCVQGMKLIPDDSIDTCVTSPPYWNVRDYGVDGQVGLEDDYKQYIKKLVDVFHEVKRVLKPDGTLWLNINDTYAANRTYQVSQSIHKGHDYGKSNGMKVPEGLKEKDMIGIPWKSAFALQEDGWYLRSDIIWQKPNPMPESVKDRPTRSHEFIFLMSKSKKYYYDYESIKENTLDGSTKKNKTDVWTVQKKSFKEAHFATFPEDLIVPCILGGSREGGVVLDPFMGAGTTALVAAKNNRNFIGFELNHEYIEIANKRLDSIDYSSNKI